MKLIKLYKIHELNDTSITQFQTMNFMKNQTTFHQIFNIISENKLSKDSKNDTKEQSQKQESNRTHNSFLIKKQIKNNFIHKQHDEIPRNKEISSQLIILKIENEELKRKLNEKSEKKCNIINGIKVEIKKIKQILSNAQQQQFIYPFDNIDTESIGSLEKVGEVNQSFDSKSV